MEAGSLAELVRIAHRLDLTK
jgi:hypothetical protein